MAELRNPNTGGFTLVEMLVAMGILVFGLTSLMALMAVGVSTRASAELRDRAVLAAARIFEQVEAGDLADLPEDAEIEEGRPVEPVELDSIPGYPRLRAKITFATDETLPDLVLVTVDVTWLEQGLTVGEKFRRVLDHGVPFPARVGRKRSKR